MDETIQSTIEEMYGVKLLDTVQTYRGVQFSVQSRPEQRYLLKPAGSPIHRIVYTYACMRYLYDCAYTGTELYLLTKDKVPYIMLGNTPYIAIPVFRGHECSLEDEQDVLKAARELARMHLAGRGFTRCKATEYVRHYLPKEYDREPFVRVDAGKMPDLFAKRCAELKRFQRLAKKSANPFDCAYVAMASENIQRAEAICKSLSEGVYEKALTQCNTDGAICHKDYTGHNVLFTGSKTIILNFDQCSIDLPICDLANLIKRRMRKCGWNETDAWHILEAYGSLRNLTREDYLILQLILAFPQKLWRVVNKYYNSRKTWCEKSCLMKLTEIQGEQEALDSFLESLDKRFTGVYH